MPPSSLPDGEPVPASGELPGSALAGLATTDLGIYVHVPFCSVRCGYCDFNTYTLTELGPRDGSAAAIGLDTYADAALAELDLARRVLGDAALPVSTVFVGGGTPTMLRSADLVRVLSGIRERFGLTPGAEVTTEANPDSVTPESLAELAVGGFTRVSLGMQSAVPHVLATLERTHDPDNVARAVEAVRAVGMQVSLDLIYGTPGESLADWRRSLEAAVAMGPDHVSAYALVVEDGTKLAGQVRRGQVPMPEDDDEADKYELADELLTRAGYQWYEVSNWARSDGARCRHNLAYWSGANWWGVGPGAHSHVGGVRWWNAKHPAAYAARLVAGGSPALAREILSGDQRYDETVLLGTRIVDGLPLDVLRGSGRAAVAGLIADGLVDGPAAVGDGRVVLTRRGRLLADTVVHRLIAW
ncbi:radical SAM family heme chaperone HemW [Intrasporangium calvum]|uniref:Heme chaperone HemW n=1 Tax=Intrasporangium calvum (strain ATCC 23552 / DSM 43043 / JCM 3097 / NBRC 12989 / NCIMB 10167 / NRRL B-3866 / 7 KIP) TaxID=710696 RepID=E6SDK5_INTC7|nr:radical SAM family heme chaperone HemW [Intrasporangium calvum]ADU48657.1 coproporphyrinogen III oxidase, anaerobic [Intrasporangium calvum DSM 43043]